MTLYNKYRPKKLSEVVGQEAVIESLEGILSRKEQQSFLFTGPAGTGKTSIARIVARMLGCKLKDRLEIDGATYTGIDDMRKVQDIIRYRPFGDGEKRAVIGDEVHRLSQQAWDSLLKAVEEPPAHVIWLFCTTNPDKIPKTIRTRCATLALKEIPDNDLHDLVSKVAQAENIQIPEQVMGLIVREARGSARQAITNLEVCRGITDRGKAAQLLKTVLETTEVVDLCRFLLKGGSWKMAMRLVSKLEGQEPEGIRRIVCAYMTKVLQGSSTDKEACYVLNILDAFSSPYLDRDGSSLLVSIGKVLYNE